MTNPDFHGQRPLDDQRPAIIARLGGYMIAMLGICVPLCAIMGAFAGAIALLLPVAVIVGMSLCMTVIWFTPVQRNKTNAREIAELQTQIADLHKRLSNLEIMDSFERRHMQSASMPSTASPHPAPEQRTDQIMQPGVQQQGQQQ